MVKKLAATAVYVPCSPGSIYDSKWKVWFTDPIVKPIIAAADDEEDLVETEIETKTEKTETGTAVSNGAAAVGKGEVKGGAIGGGDKGAVNGRIVGGGIKGGGAVGVEEVHSPMVKKIEIVPPVKAATPATVAAAVAATTLATAVSASGSAISVGVSGNGNAPASLVVPVSANLNSKASANVSINGSEAVCVPPTVTTSAAAVATPKTVAAASAVTQAVSSVPSTEVQVSVPSPAVDLTSQHTDNSKATNNVTTVPVVSGVPNKSESASNIITTAAPVAATSAESNLQINTTKTIDTGNSAKLDKEKLSDKDVQSPLISLLPTTEAVKASTAITQINQHGSDNDKNKIVGTDKDKDKEKEKDKSNGNNNGNSNGNSDGNDNDNDNAGTTTIQDQSAKKYCCFSIFGFTL